MLPDSLLQLTIPCFAHEVTILLNKTDVFIENNLDLERVVPPPTGLAPKLIRRSGRIFVRGARIGTEIDY